LCPVFVQKDGTKRENREQNGQIGDKSKMPETLEIASKKPATVEVTGFAFWWTLGGSNPYGMW
jgi:hypothetical protein